MRCTGLRRSTRGRGAGLGRFVTASALASAIALASPVGLGGGAGDARQLVELPPDMRQHMLANMRDHLAALGDIQAAIAASRFSRAAEIAEVRLGLSSLGSHGASHMAPYMPEGMRAIGNDMHRAASRFAVVAQDSELDGDAMDAVGALAEVTRQCVACHAAYRVQ